MHHRSQGAFSLLETILTLVIVLVLLMLLLPVVGSALSSVDFVKCISERGELGRATLVYVTENEENGSFMKTPLPHNNYHALAVLTPYGVNKSHLTCSGFERRFPDQAGEFHFMPTGTRPINLKKVTAYQYVLYYETMPVHGLGIVKVMGDGRATFKPM